MMWGVSPQIGLLAPGHPGVSRPHRKNRGLAKQIQSQVGSVSTGQSGIGGWRWHPQHLGHITPAQRCSLFLAQLQALPTCAATAPAESELAGPPVLLSLGMTK
jgi:hypothetical protein